ncbi:hypothetical protein K435DRAFT_870260 [Dendrothele bispora CBS 962.96]|uniref:Transposase domain-containing protein n=1 Tax=Dendrothele bispora (strain CBS 962.96) TaxID=1314807 RepID=A0A4S8L706_DENBC|nr:hypothetical protein K435DRAFT_870260 [Dendrothele bispora CBS 962.96]
MPDPSTCLDRLVKISTQEGSALFIPIETHPDAGIPSQLISLDSQNDSDTKCNLQTDSNPDPTYAGCCPWAPFRSLADFEYTEIAIRSGMAKQTVDSQLRLMHTSWTKRSKITLSGYSDMINTLSSAQGICVRFQNGSLIRTYRGKSYTFEFCFRDPWEWVVSLVTYPTLAGSICWYPVCKYLHSGTHVQRLFDEPQTAEMWWNIQDTIKKTNQYPHCFLPLLVWLDKGNVTRKVKLHPMIAQASFLPNIIRNTSGNSSGVLLGYLPSVSQIVGFHDPANEAEKAEQCIFKLEVYHGILEVVFESLQKPAKIGECINCADKITRVLFPGIPYAALDGEEAWAYACIRAANANFPCPRCLVPHHELDLITGAFPLRTTASMESVFWRARAAPTATEKSNILKSVGLHDVANFFWSLPHSDPYKAISYDTLHKDDLGKFGKHIYPVLVRVIEEAGLTGKLNQNMNQVPSWSNLKHFRQITTLEYVDGKDMLHILKCIIPCIVQLLPRNSSLLRCIHSLAQIWMMIDLNCISEDHLSRLKGYIARYQRFCQLVSQEYDKLFVFPKQHDVSHIISDIREKGVTHNYSTRPGESFQQGARQAYERTNKKNVDPQMTRIDGYQEVVARIRLEVDESDRISKTDSDLNPPLIDPSSAQPDKDYSNTVGDKTLKQHLSNTSKHWTLGADVRRRWISCLDLQTTVPTTLGFKDIGERLHKFLKAFVSPNLASNADIELRQYHFLTLRYVSCVDWTLQADLLRSNPSFNGKPRYDCALLNTDSKKFEFV